ncbi:hypothetical protein [Catenuloplanes japonicus]|uniref:hypothetical protein n=1 Tax=Catenuloplanes japonicus TaxID=33876 RepID=UPI000AB50E1F|nr:hypothetical protein [Catenuloplanes japonicus]
MATEREREGTSPPPPSPAADDDDLDQVVRRAVERAGEIAVLSAKINDLHGQIEAYRRQRGN